MPQHKSCKKRLKTSALSKVRNSSVRTAIRTSVKSVTDATTYEDALKAFPVAVAALDRAVGKMVVHKNNAARTKSRLAAKVALLKG